MIEPLAEKFQTAMFDIYRRAKAEARYNATIFLRMLTDRGGVSTAKTLINAEQQSDGYTALMLAGRLDLTVEALIVDEERYQPLFLPEEIEKARKRLSVNQYKFGSRKQSK